MNKQAASFSTRIFDHSTYKYTTSVSHKGTIIAFAMDTNRRIYFTALDLAQKDAAINDADNWTDPQELQFPYEIEEVGFAVVPPTKLPECEKNADSTKPGNEIPARELEQKEKDEFWSSTALGW